QPHLHSFPTRRSSDLTDYTSAAAQHFLQVPSDLKNENLFSLRVAKSVNVNIYPVVLKYRMVKTKTQRLYASVGLGLQIYNFRFRDRKSTRLNSSHVKI